MAIGSNWWQAPAKQVVTRSPERIGVSSTAALNASPAYQALTAAKKAGTNVPVNNAAMDRFYQTATSARANTTPYKPPVVNKPKVNTGGGSSGRSGGGGGAAAPVFNQANIDWLTQLLARSKPGAVSASVLDLPEYQGSFDTSMYTDLENRLGQAIGQSRVGADTAYNNLGQYLTQNYSNAFNNPNNTYATAGQAPGMDQTAMARLMQSQGANPALANEQAQGAAGADQAFGNLWRVLAGNEDRQQQNRLNRLQSDRGTTNMALDAAQLGGMTGIGMQRGQAQQAWNQQAEQARNQIAQQEALANWQRQNEVSDLNTANSNSYINAQMQALLGLMPEFKGTGTPMPDLNTLLAGR